MHSPRGEPAPALAASCAKATSARSAEGGGDGVRNLVLNPCIVSRAGLNAYHPFSRRPFPRAPLCASYQHLHRPFALLPTGLASTLAPRTTHSADTPRTQANHAGHRTPFVLRSPSRSSRSSKPRKIQATEPQIGIHSRYSPQALRAVSTPFQHLLLRLPVASLRRKQPAIAHWPATNRLVQLLRTASQRSICAHVTFQILKVPSFLRRRVSRICIRTADVDFDLNLASHFLCLPF